MASLPCGKWTFDGLKLIVNYMHNLLVYEAVRLSHTVRPIYMLHIIFTINSDCFLNNINRSVLVKSTPTVNCDVGAEHYCIIYM
jgi:hypothetical protein